MNGVRMKWKMMTLVFSVLLTIGCGRDKDKDTPGPSSDPSLCANSYVSQYLTLRDKYYAFAHDKKWDLFLKDQQTDISDLCNDHKLILRLRKDFEETFSERSCFLSPGNQNLVSLSDINILTLERLGSHCQ
jgi:hypothetical protein